MYKRVLLKLSGEALTGQERNFDPVVLRALAEEIKEVSNSGIQVAIVVCGAIPRSASLHAFSIFFKLDGS